MKATAHEISMLRELAEEKGVTASDIVRLLVRADHAAIFGAPAKKKIATR